ncbi:neuroligin-4, X-linked-like [Paramacrobiotus metropolitanus]|uniref:neuroligin-4, X-linked-like n=1 Tax=Paramacrobiotus metropolitanus TaxID=2943436 RepID=UPI0024460C9F|nr:neuroligin-4, X-linked-like [Paramacrobiotus metropolitanus]
MNVFWLHVLPVLYLLDVPYAFSKTPSARNGTTRLQCSKYHKRRLMVHTTSGPVEGTTACISKNERVMAFLGIPYAEPPLNNLRFRPPVKKAHWNSTLEAFRFGPVCLQPGEMPSICERMWTSPPYALFNQSEDCLTLNIFTPNLTGSNPVMFFIHGGSYIVGAGGLHPGERLSYMGTVVVTFNYRLGVFGFLSTADSAAPGNYGLMDQVMALEWVHENIALFGGNPRNITIFGQSAGAAAVHLHLLSNKTKDMFTTAIMHSGVGLAPWAIQRMPSSNARVLAEAVGCPISPSSVMVSCLRNKNESEILGFTDLGQLFSIPWAPVVDRDWIMEEPEILLQKGHIQNKSVIIGVTDDEATIVLYNLPSVQARNRTFNMTKQFVIDKVIPRLVEEAGYKNPREIEAALKFYYIDTAREESVGTMRQNYAQMLTDAIFTSGVLRSIKYHSQIGIPTYFFVFDYHSQNDSLPAWTGAYHGVDLKYLFGCPFIQGSSELQEELDKVISDLMMKLWINFAQNGDPINSNDFTQKIGWSPYRHDTGQYYLNISASLPRRQQYYRHEHVVFWNSYMPIVASLGTEKSDAVATSSSSNSLQYYMTMMWLAAAIAILLFLIIVILVVKFVYLRKGKHADYTVKGTKHAGDHQNGPHSDASTSGRSASRYLDVPQRV